MSKQKKEVGFRSVNFMLRALVLVVLRPSGPLCEWGETRKPTYHSWLHAFSFSSVKVTGAGHQDCTGRFKPDGHEESHLG